MSSSKEPQIPDTLPSQGTPTASFLPMEREGMVLGNYTLEKKLGEGGMGSVWIARQAEPVKRQVALKLIKTGVDERTLLVRFDQERQALALMDHPHIARVYDAGVVKGLPYFVMELVRGPTLLNYCDEKKLTPRERLELFIPVCHAIQHAHQKGIIHRDLKPANILVASVDGRAVPKIIDFGVAKAVSGKLIDQSLNTAFGTVVGTLEYMAPEQAVGHDDVDTRADIYALGVILYELLVGVRPFDGKRLCKAALLEAIRIIQDEEPSKPSTRLSTIDALPSIAAVRQIEPRHLLKMLQGDLDWIIMKCLEKDRNQRYETANGLAMEIQRYLQDEPILASPPGTLYRLKKFFKRHRGGVLAASLIVLSLLVGVVTTTWAALEARHQAALAKAETAEKEKARLAEHDAKLLTQKRLEQIQKGQKLLHSIFADLDPHAEDQEGRPLRQILADRLDRAEKELAGEAIGDPATVAELQDILGQSFHGLGYYDRARTLLKQAETTYLKLLTPDHQKVLSVKADLAANEMAAGQWTKAISLFEELLAQRQLKWGRNHPETIKTLADYASVWAIARRPEKAIPLLEEALEFWRNQVGEKEELTIYRITIDLSACYTMAAQPVKAVSLLEPILPVLDSKPGLNQLIVASCLSNLSDAYRTLHQVNKAIPPLERALAIRESKLSHDHPDTLTIRNNLAGLYWMTQNFERSIPLFEKIVADQERRQRALHPATMTTLANLSVNYRDSGKAELAMSTAEQFLTRFPKLELRNKAGCVWFLTDAADLYEARQPARQLQLLEQHLALSRQLFPADHPDVAYALNCLGTCHLQHQRYPEAEKALREALVIREKKEPDDWTTFNTRSALGGALLEQALQTKDASRRQALLKETEPLLNTGYLGMKQRLASISQKLQRRRIPEALNRLIRYYTETRQLQEADHWLNEKKDWEKSNPGR